MKINDICCTLVGMAHCQSDDKLARKVTVETVPIIFDTLIARMEALKLSNDDGDIGNLAWWDEQNRQVVTEEDLDNYINGTDYKEGCEEEGDAGAYYVYWHGGLDRAYRVASEEEATLLRAINTLHALKCCIEEE